MKPKKESAPPSMDDVLRRMLNTPPTPHVAKPAKKAAKKPEFREVSESLAAYRPVTPI